MIQLFIYIFFFRLLFIRGYYKILNTVPCAIQQILLYFIYSGTHLLVPYSLLLPTFPFGCYWLLKFAKHSYGPQSKHTHTHTHTHRMYRFPIPSCTKIPCVFGSIYGILFYFTGLFMHEYQCFNYRDFSAFFILLGLVSPLNLFFCSVSQAILT